MGQVVYHVLHGPAFALQKGHAEAANLRAQGKQPYVPTHPVLGGLRVSKQPFLTKLAVMVGMHRPVKILPIYQRYSALPPLDAAPGFVVQDLRSFSEADIVVVEELADIDAGRSEYLAVALLWSFGLGKVVACRKDVETFMHSPSVQNEAAMLHFAPAVHAKAIGVQVRDPLAQCLGHWLRATPPKE